MVGLKYQQSHCKYPKTGHTIWAVERGATYNSLNFRHNSNKTSPPNYKISLFHLD